MLFLKSISFLFDEGPMLETLDYTIRIGSTQTFLYFKFVSLLCLYAVCIIITKYYYYITIYVNYILLLLYNIFIKLYSSDLAKLDRI